jgi:hypothetical protein
MRGFATRPPKSSPGLCRITGARVVINLRTAKTLGLTVPLIMQMTADEVIE